MNYLSAKRFVVPRDFFSRNKAGSYKVPMGGYVQRTKRRGDHMSFHLWFWEYIGGLCDVTGQDSGRQTVQGCYGASWLCALQVPTSWDFFYTPCGAGVTEWWGYAVHVLYQTPNTTFPQASPSCMLPSFAHFNYFRGSTV